MGIMEKLSDMRRKSLDAKKFDQQQYMMDRYSADRQFDEAVELLNSCGMIVEAKS